VAVATFYIEAWAAEDAEDDADPTVA